MANQTGRKREVSVADLSAAFLEALASENTPPPDGAFTTAQAAKSMQKSEKRALDMLRKDARLESRMYRGSRYYWPKA